ncbi:hypothetical protein PTKIN_Ptkin13bG0017000 [Pterospermum kingtungense]
MRNKATRVRIENKLGKLISMDETMDKGGWAEFLRLRIEVDRRKPLHRTVKLAGGPGKREIWGRLAYERLPTFCYCCGLLRHSDSDCETVVNCENKFKAQLKASLSSPGNAGNSCTTVGSSPAKSLIFENHTIPPTNPNSHEGREDLTNSRISDTNQGKSDTFEELELRIEELQVNDKEANNVHKKGKLQPLGIKKVKQSMSEAWQGIIESAKIGGEKESPLTGKAKGDMDGSNIRQKEDSSNRPETKQVEAQAVIPVQSSLKGIIESLNPNLDEGSIDKSGNRADKELGFSNNISAKTQGQGGPLVATLK